MNNLGVYRIWQSALSVQMPDMDGFAATQAIREKERAGNAHVPIVALTAHAMKGTASAAEPPAWTASFDQLQWNSDSRGRHSPAGAANEQADGQPLCDYRKHNHYIGRGEKDLAVIGGGQRQRQGQ